MHPKNSAELISLKPIGSKTECSFNQHFKISTISGADSEADVFHSEKAISLLQKLQLLMKSFILAERRLREIKQKIWALVKNLDTEEEDISDLMPCHAITFIVLLPLLFSVLLSTTYKFSILLYFFMVELK